MIEGFFCCSVCRFPCSFPELKASPLRICELCRQSMQLAARMDEFAGAQIFSLYESGEVSWAVFKSWKKRPSAKTTDWFLKHADDRLINFLRTHSASPSVTFIPLPQSYSRRWILAGGSVNHWTQALSRHLRGRGVEVEVRADLLQLKQEFSGGLRQAEKTRQDRLLAENPFSLNLKNSGSRESVSEDNTTKVYLIDDFFTTGTTLQWAYQTLNDAGLKIKGALILAKRTA